MRNDPVEAVSAFVARHRLLASGQPVLALVSGGADSMCLLDMLLRVHAGPLSVLAIDHGLRPAAADECELVAAFAGARGVPTVVRRLYLDDGSGVPERARDARRALADSVADEVGATAIATGHTATDQAETVLFRLARGSGRTGALGMAARTGRIIRPLLTLTRAETRAWCRSHGVPFVDDPTNTDPTYARARVRHEVIPALEGVHPGAGLAIARFAEILSDEAEVLELVVDSAWERCAVGDGLAAARLAAEPLAVARLLVRRLLHAAGLTAEAAVVTRALEIAVAGAGRADVAGGTVAVVRGVLTAAGVAGPLPRAVGLDVPGVVQFGAMTVRATPAPASAPTPTGVSVRVGDRLLVRSVEPGDRIALAGGGHAKVGRLLAGAGVPAWGRARVPVVVDSGRVVWVGGYRADPGLLAAPGDPAIRLELV